MWIDVAADVIERFGTNTSGNLYFDRVKWCLKCFFDTKSTKKGASRHQNSKRGFLMAYRGPPFIVCELHCRKIVCKKDDTFSINSYCSVLFIFTQKRQHLK